MEQMIDMHLKDGAIDSEPFLEEFQNRGFNYDNLTALSINIFNVGIVLNLLYLGC